ncbi:MAG: preprotein translocase subunit YajC [Salibacteraceae bacterium]
MQLATLLMLGSPDGGEGGGPSMLIMFALIGVIFYFFMIRPQAKKAKETKKFREALGKGDRIVTIGGVHGKIAEMKETTVIIEVENGGRLKIERSAISMEYTSGGGTSELQQQTAKKS